MDKVKVWLENECPLIWHILNHKAKSNIPKGINDFLNSGSESEIEDGKMIFSIIEKYLKTLTQKISTNDVSNNYRRELSSIDSEKQLSEIFSEISVCATISKISNDISLKPISRKPKRSDFKATIENSEIYGEVKRYEDKKRINRRSILTKDDYHVKQKTTRPRFSELYSKLENVYKQLPSDSINIIFLFHSSFGETVKYIKQVLFGEHNFWNKNENLILEPNSLFSKVEWENISALCLCRLGKKGFVEFYEIFKNPKANNHLPEAVADKIKMLLYA